MKCYVSTGICSKVAGRENTQTSERYTYSHAEIILAQAYLSLSKKTRNSICFDYVQNTQKLSSERKKRYCKNEKG
jgi:hypothetical protein